MTPSDALVETKKLLALPRNWIQGDNARLAKDGEVCSFSDPKATCFCLYGALNRATIGSENVTAWYKAKDYLSDAIRDLGGTGFVPGWNDDNNRTHADIIRTLDLAIEKAKASQ